MNVQDKSAVSCESGFEEQLQLEVDILTDAANRYRTYRDESSLSDSRAGADFLRNFIGSLATEIEAEQLRQTGSSVATKRPKYSLPLLSLDPFKLALITLRSLLNAVGLVDRPTLIQVAQEIGRGCYLEYRIDQAEGRERRLYDFLIRRGANPSTAKRRVLEMIDKFSSSDWSQGDLDLHLGSHLICLAEKSTGAFSISRSRSEIGPIKTPTVIALSSHAEQWLKRRDAILEDWASPFYLPMLVEPADWSDLHGGGFLSNKRTLALSIVKHRGNLKHLDILKKRDLGVVYSAINALQKTSWRINGYVFSVLSRAVDSGLLPMKEDEAKETKVSSAKTLLLHGERFSSRRIYFPHQFDRRGRAYPLPQMLSPQGSDIARSLLEFAEGMSLGSRGGYWLSVHLANCYGMQRLAFDQRIRWVEENYLHICNLVKDPLANLDFWRSADKPWSFLAAAYEYCEYRDRGPTHVSYLPVSVDGTCNGLQHLSALAGDEVGGQATNLVPGEKPEDIYQRVADLASLQVEEDARGGHPLALHWVGRVNRKLAKPATMTTPYGVQRAGIERQLADSTSVKDAKIPFRAIAYMAEVLETNIGRVVVSAGDVMSWLHQVARVLASSQCAPCWVTPSGFRVLHEYPREIVRRITTAGGTLQIRDADPTGRLDRRKQVNAIVPNFIHSLDAAHMVLTVSALASEGVSHFSMVHDSFGCHACNMDSLGSVLRQKFLAIYKEDVMATFHSDVSEQLPSVALPSPPARRGLDIELVLRSPYFFS